jgi:hypothetical protein
MPFDAAIFSVLAADAELVSLLSSYDPAGAGTSGPAIFVEPVPEGAVAPFVVLIGLLDEDPMLDDNSDDLGSEVAYGLRCLAPQSGSTILVERIAERVRALLHRQPIAVDGYVTVDVRISGPVVADEIDLYGRALTARLLLDEE